MAIGKIYGREGNWVLVNNKHGWAVVNDKKRIYDYPVLHNDGEIIYEYPDFIPMYIKKKFNPIIKKHGEYVF